MLSDDAAYGNKKRSYNDIFFTSCQISLRYTKVIKGHQRRTTIGVA